VRKHGGLKPTRPGGGDRLDPAPRAAADLPPGIALTDYARAGLQWTRFTETHFDNNLRKKKMIDGLPQRCPSTCARMCVRACVRARARECVSLGRERLEASRALGRPAPLLASSSSQRVAGRQAGRQRRAC
jgi:hypothetical protein